MGARGRSGVQQIPDESWRSFAIEIPECEWTEKWTLRERREARSEKKNEFRSHPSNFGRGFDSHLPNAILLIISTLRED